MLPWEIFENLHTVEAILVLFEQFLGKFCLKFLPLFLSASPNAMHFVGTFSIREGGVISDKIYFCDSRVKLRKWNYQLFVQNCR